MADYFGPLVAVWLVLAFYGAVMIWLRKAWIGIPIADNKPCESWPALTLLIPFRNEETALPVLFRCLQWIEYKGEWEIILINDNSNDSSGSLAAAFCNRFSRARLCHLEASEGKKAALLLGTAQAAHDWIVLTDADCSPQPLWLEEIGQLISIENPALIAGLTAIHPNATFGFLNDFQRLEMAALSAFSLAAIAAGKPMYCSSANLAFSRKHFESLTDPFYNRLPHGDDTFLLQKLMRQKNARIIPLKSPHSVVYTTGVQTLKDFFSQRKRWISKMKYYRSMPILAAGWMVGLANFVMLPASFWLVQAYPGSGYMAAAWIFKLTMDWMFMLPLIRYFSIPVSVFRFAGLGLIYPFYLSFVGFSSMCGSLTWKGRKMG